MKLKPGEIEGFLRKPPAALRAALIFGPDQGLVHERAKALAATLVPDLDPTFNLVNLSAAQLGDDPARLNDEAAAMSLMGGRRVVTVSNAGDRLGKLFAEFLSELPGDALVIVEAGELTGRSSLRSAFEAAPLAVAVPCYADDPHALAGVIRSMIQESGHKVDDDALAFLRDNLGSDRLVTRGEINKLLLYKGDEAGPITLQDAEACIGDSSVGNLDDAAFAAFGGDIAKLAEALAQSEMAGESPVAILRVTQKHAQRLHLGIARMNSGGGDPKFLAKSLGVFWKREDAFVRQLKLWSPERLMRALEILTDAELNAKSTGIPADAVTGDALLRIARAARVAR